VTGEKSRRKGRKTFREENVEMKYTGKDQFGSSA